MSGTGVPQTEAGKQVLIQHFRKQKMPKKLWQPGQSGNPKGRPAGKTLEDRLKRAIARDFDQLVERIISDALAGDATAQKLLISRVCPPQISKLSLHGQNLIEQAESILTGIATGEILPGEGKARFANMVDELVQRIKYLEKGE